MTLLYSRKLGLLLSDSGEERLGRCCHYSDRQNGEPAECPPQPGNQWWELYSWGTRLHLFDSLGVSINPILQPTHQSAGSYRLCISRCGLNLSKPAKTRSISALIRKYPHSSRIRLCQFDFDSFPNIECSILESGCLWCSFPPWSISSKLFLWDVTRLSDMNFNELSKEHTRWKFFPSVVSVIGV